MEKREYLSPEWTVEAARRLRQSLTPEQMKHVVSHGCETMSKFPLAVHEV